MTKRDLPNKPKPYHRQRYARLSIERPPRTEPLTPRLRRDWRTKAIGFHHVWKRDESSHGR